MNHLPLIRKSLCKKNSLHNAELFLASRPSHSSPAELNIRLLKQKEKRNALSVDVQNIISQNNFALSKQNNEASTYCKKIIKQDSLINFEMSSAEIYNKFRAYYEWPGISIEHKNTIVKIKGMYVLDKNNTFQDNAIFKFDNSKLIMKTIDKAIVITHLQFPNKNPISSLDAYNSHKEFFK